MGGENVFKLIWFIMSRYLPGIYKLLEVTMEAMILACEHVSRSNDVLNLIMPLVRCGEELADIPPHLW